MAYNDAQAVNPRWHRSGSDVVLSWDSLAPDGTTFQVYLNGVLTWAGTATRCKLPAFRPNTVVDVGSVAAGESRKNLSGSLPARPSGRARVTWQGGGWLGSRLSGFYVYAGKTPGAAVDYSAPYDAVPYDPAADAFGFGPFGSAPFGYGTGVYSWTSPALAPGVWNFAVASYDSTGDVGTAVAVAVTVAGPPPPPAAGADAFGFGPFGSAPFGYGTGVYSWTSPALAPGVWNFAVASYDTTGDVGTAVAVAVTVAGPPPPPAAGADGKRLGLSYNATTRVVTLNWTAGAVGSLGNVHDVT